MTHRLNIILNILMKKTTKKVISIKKQNYLLTICEFSKKQNYTFILEYFLWIHKLMPKTTTLLTMSKTA